MEGKTPVVVSTESNETYFGWADESGLDKKDLWLHGAKQCTHGAVLVGGVTGLASSGPTKGCRVGPVVDRLLVHAVKAVMIASEQAQRAWQSQ